MNTNETEMLDKQENDRERDRLGAIVREVWIAWAKEQPTPKPSWLVPYKQLSEPDKEVDRRIGERLFFDGSKMARRLLAVANGCHDYNGGNVGTDLRAFHHGIDTVINALTAAYKNDPNDVQVNALDRMGRASLLAPEKPV